MSTKKKTAVATTRKAPPRKMSGKPARRRSTRRRSMRGMSAKSMMDTVSDMAQVGIGMIGYGLASKMARKQWPTANGHLINAGGVVLGVLVGENVKPMRKVAIGFGGAAIGNSVMNMLPESLMQGHTRNGAGRTPAQEKMIADALAKAQRKIEDPMSSALNGERPVTTLNGSVEDYV